MRLERIDGGFVQYYDNSVVEKIIFLGQYVKVGTIHVRISENKTIERDELRHIGNSTIYFHNKPPKEFSNINFNTVHNRTYGVPISEDGSKLFVGRWEREEGLRAYDIETGTMLWRFKQGKIRNVFVYPDYLIAMKTDEAVFKMSLDSGDVLGKIKSGTLGRIFDLGERHILVDSLSGKLGVIDTSSMTITKKYSDKVVNHPSKGIGVTVRTAILQDNVLYVSGADSFASGGSQEFEQRIIDTSFSGIK